MQESKEVLQEISEKISKIKEVFDFSVLKSEVEKLEKEMSQENFWNNAAKAEKVTQDLAHKKKILETWEEIENESNDLHELLDIAQGTEIEEIKEQAKKLLDKINEKEILVFLSGEHDRGGAILSIFAGTGGTDAQDWAEMLLRMYLRFVEKNGFKSKIIQKSDGEEAGIKSVDLEIKGEFAYGFLKCESGVHRLVRLSPFNAKNLRQTSFAQVSAVPIIEGNEKVKIDPKEIRVDVFRSGGAGGQSVNTTDSAVRVTHLPSGITVSCQNERSQLQNKETCFKILRGKLFEKKTQEEEKKLRTEKGEHKETSWGNQIRSYVLHPYKMVKDLRSKIETNDVEKVLDGDLKEFIETELRRKVRL